MSCLVYCVYCITHLNPVSQRTTKYETTYTFFHAYVIACLCLLLLALKRTSGIYIVKNAHAQTANYNNDEAIEITLLHLRKRNSCVTAPNTRVPTGFFFLSRIISALRLLKN